jgi:hypothetical protein
MFDSCSTRFAGVRLGQRGKDCKAACFSVVVPKKQKSALPPTSVRRDGDRWPSALDRPESGETSAADGRTVSGDRSVTDRDGVRTEETEIQQEDAVAIA